jgi:hypothetical protein
MPACLLPCPRWPSARQSRRPCSKRKIPPREFPALMRLRPRRGKRQQEQPPESWLYGTPTVSGSSFSNSLFSPYGRRPRTSRGHPGPILDRPKLVPLSSALSAGLFKRGSIAEPVYLPQSESNPPEQSLLLRCSRDASALSAELVRGNIFPWRPLQFGMGYKRTRLFAWSTTTARFVN